MCEHLLRKTGKVNIVSNQIQVSQLQTRPSPSTNIKKLAIPKTNNIQFSFIDARPLHRMVHVCRKHNLRLLTYGTLVSSVPFFLEPQLHSKAMTPSCNLELTYYPQLGGFLSEKWLNTPYPDPYSTTNPLTPSRRKYLDMITTWGTWTEFQQLLSTTEPISIKHNATIADVAIAWVLRQQAMGAVLIGNKLDQPGSRHVAAGRKEAGVDLDDGDLQALNNMALGTESMVSGGVSWSKVNAMIESIGDCGAED